MKYIFSESLKEANSASGEGSVTFWIRTIIDTGKSILKENLDNIKGGEKMIKKNKDIVSVFVVTAGILMLPLIGMQFSEGIDWDLTDFLIMGALISGTGLLMVLVARKIKKPAHRIVIILGLLALFLMIWAHLAVGLFEFLPFAGS